MGERWFYYDADGDGFQLVDTEEQAREAAEESMRLSRQSADDDGEWSSSVDCICWGEIRQIAQDTTPTKLTADYQLCDPT